jgi:hypothetical protein
MEEVVRLYSCQESDCLCFMLKRFRLKVLKILSDGQRCDVVHHFDSLSSTTSDCGFGFSVDRKVFEFKSGVFISEIRFVIEEVFRISL